MIQIDSTYEAFFKIQLADSETLKDHGMVYVRDDGTAVPVYFLTYVGDLPTTNEEAAAMSELSWKLRQDLAKQGVIGLPETSAASLCGYCHLHLHPEENDYCTECPIYAYTNVIGCARTPYSAWATATTTMSEKPITTSQWQYFLETIDDELILLSIVEERLLA